MRRITIWLVGTLCGLILLLSYRTSTTGASSTAAGVPSPASPAPASPTPASPSPATGAGSSSSSTGQSTSGQSTSGQSTSGQSTSGQSTSAQFTGTSVDTRWGPVQVLITVSSGKITKAEAVVYPQNNGRDMAINAQALPILAAEVVKAQSAHIDTVSGATVTSDGYLTSLQSAIDQAHLGT